MGYVYDVLGKAKLAIVEVDENDETSYMEYWKIIDRKLEIKFHHPLHLSN